MSFWEVYLELAKLGMQEKDARRKFAFDMAEKQGELAEKIVGGLLKLIRAATDPTAVVDAVFDEELAPGSRIEPHAPCAVRHAPPSLVEDVLAQISSESRMNVLAALRLYDEQTAVGVLELFFADLEAKKSPRFPPMEPQTPAPGRF